MIDRRMWERLLLEMYDRDIDRPCANTLFPHSGYPPCWYLRRHKEQQTKI